MKRPPGIWILLSAGVLWLNLQNVCGIRATALIFGRSTTTTTKEGISSESSPDETATELSTETSNVTKPTLTGIPQLDYIWDPNLPQELNGYNLSEYPFYERVPEDIDINIEFKCDGLHDGFYASVPHKCQVYHHCLYGTRYDFLCANYTAFDQKTFICHFVSEVDCVNSKKYWHRNDALYEVATTTTVKPVVVHTPPPHPPGEADAPRRPNGSRRRPLRRRRPQYDYYEYDDEYDDYYDERPRSESRRRNRPRPRPRPIYEEDYAEYEDRYERRNTGRHDEERSRKNHDRRGSEDRRPDRRRNKDRRKYEDDVKVMEKEAPEEERKVESKRPDDRRYHKRRPVDDYVSEEDDRRRSRPKGVSRRPVEEDYVDEEPSQKPKSPPPDSDKAIIKPTSGTSIYDRPRTAPKVKPPVPKSEASKYAYKPMVSSTPAREDEEYYSDYEEELPPQNHRKPESGESKRQSSRHEEERDTRKQLPSATRLRPLQSTREDNYEDETPRRPHKPKYGSGQRERPRPNSNNKKPSALDDYFEDYESEASTERLKPGRRERSTSTTASPKTATTATTIKTTAAPTQSTTVPTTSTTTVGSTTPKFTTTPKINPRPDAIVRIVKRPFLPSRGGNPYSSRGLQPVGAKAVDKNPETKDDPDNDETMEIKPILKLKMPPPRQQYAAVPTDPQEEFKPVSNRPQLPTRPTFKPNKEYAGPRTTQKPKLPELEPVDIQEDEYDVTLNDALNPTLPNFPVRSFPTGFSSVNDYNYNSFQRPRYVLEGANSDYYQPKQVRQRYEEQQRFANSDADYKGQYSTTHGHYRPRVTQAYYTSF